MGRYQLTITSPVGQEWTEQVDSWEAADVRMCELEEGFTAVLYQAGLVVDRW